MPHLSPPTLTEGEARAILAVTAGNWRDHLIYSSRHRPPLGRARRPQVGDVYAPDGTPRSRVRIRAEIAKGGRTGDIFLLDALVPKLRKLWAHKRLSGEGTGPQIRSGGHERLPGVAGPVPGAEIRT